MTITEFLLARIAEDEAVVARYTRKPGDGVGHIYSGDFDLDRESDVQAYEGGPAAPSRTLAECQAKRRIVADHVEWGGWRGNRPTCQRCYDGDEPHDDSSEWPCLVLRAFAGIYANHPDHDPAWRS